MDAIDPELIKHAVRLSKQYGDLLVDPLRCQVAINRDKRCRGYAMSVKAQISKLVQEHITDRFPLPARAGRYTVDEWERVRRQWLRDSPVAVATRQEISRWANTLRKEIGDESFNALFTKSFSGGTLKPESQLQSLLETAGYTFGEVPKTKRTYEALHEKYTTFCSWCEKLTQEITLLSDLSLYGGEDPERVLDKLKDSEAKYHLEKILTQCHGITFGSRYDKVVPDFLDVLDGRATLQDVVNAQNMKEQDYLRKRLAWRRACHEAVILGAKTISDRTSHLPSINRLLKQLGPQLRINRIQSDHYGYHYELRFKGGRHGARWDKDPETAFDALKTELTYLATNITPAHIEDDDKFYDVMRQAENIPIEQMNEPLPFDKELMP